MRDYLKKGCKGCGGYFKKDARAIVRAVQKDAQPI